MPQHSLKNVSVVEQAESAVSNQLAEGMVDTLLDMSRSAGNQLANKDVALESLGINAIDRFWEELATTLEREPILERSQSLMISLLENLKASSLRELKTQKNIDEAIEELNRLGFNKSKTHPKPPA